MLRKLTIQNFAIIDELEIEFSNGFSAITGETGAGKSILLGALGLVLGNRAETSMLNKKEKKCIVEVLFDITENQNTQEWLREKEMEEDADLLLRREIAVNGKSRAFVNDTPVTLWQLKEVSSLLVDLHQQFDTMELGESYFQREVLDAVAGCSKDAQHYHFQFLNFAKQHRELTELKNKQLLAKKEQDYQQFLLDELTTASFAENELELLEQELKLLENAGAISNMLISAVSLLKEGDTPIVQQLKVLFQRLQQYRDVSSHIAALADRLQSTQIELQDIAEELDYMQNDIQVDEVRRNQLTERLELGYKLQKKHSVQSTGELLQLQRQLEQQVLASVNLEQEIAEKEKVTSKLHTQLVAEAGQLHQKRLQVVVPFEEKVNVLLKRVGMPNARIKAEVVTTELHAFGEDEIRFLFNANLPGGNQTVESKFEPISKVASGGELSRLMLCIQSLVAEQVKLPSLIFDEIDTGISGEAARQVGLLLQELALRHQVITITHLPQIAAKASTHYYVFKEERENEIHTKIRKLNKEEQIETIAKMLSGSQFSESTMRTAREMIMNEQ